MKKLPILLLALLCLAGCTAAPAATQPPETSLPERSQAATLPPETSPSTQPSQPAMTEYLPEQICFIGDSRTLHMKQAVQTQANFICKSSMGWAWLQAQAKPEFDRRYADAKICIVALGINDLFNLENYLDHLNAFAQEYPDTIFVYVTPGPVDEAIYKDLSNGDIEEFIAGMRQGLSSRWQILDLYAHLTAQGFDAFDGLHYTPEDSAQIFAWILESVRFQPAERGLA